MKRYGPALLLALVWPTIIAWLYFVALVGPPEDSNPNLLVQLTYASGKVIQFLLPVFCYRWWERHWPRPAAPSWRGLEIGVGFGLLVAGGIFALYFGLLRGSPLLEAAPSRIAAKVAQFNLATPGRFLLLAIFLSGLHSLLEEYYWRWFVFGYLRRFLPLLPAVVISSLGFMSHHVVVLWVYLPGKFWTGVVPLSLCIAGGGAVWALLYEWTKSLYAAWISHLLIDVALMAVGYDLVFVYLGMD